MLPWQPVVRGRKAEGGERETRECERAEEEEEGRGAAQPGVGAKE